MKDQILARINDRSARIAVIGLGYVGLPLAVAFAERGYRVTGIDVDAGRVEMLNRGESYVQDVPAQRLAPLLPPAPMGPRLDAASSADGDPLAGAFSATVDYTALVDCDAAIVCVPTPLNKTRDPDVRFLIQAGEAIAEQIHPGMLICLESTTYPGTTEEMLLPMLTSEPVRQRLGRGRFEPGLDFFLAFSPERIDPGRKDFVVENTPKVVGGVTPDCREVAVALYAQVIQTVVPVSSTAAAEMAKLLENTFRAVNIALVNEVAIMCDKLGLDVWEVIDAAATKPYGFMKFSPGPGVGGHCIPLDPHYLSWKLKTLNYNARFIQLAGEINSAMPEYWVDKVQQALNDDGKPVKGSDVLVLGVAYKKDVDDVRESPALDIIELLRQKGARVRYHDPYVCSVLHNGLGMECEPDLEGAVAAADCVLIVTDHSVYDWNKIWATARRVVDTRRTRGRVG